MKTVKIYLFIVLLINIFSCSKNEITGQSNQKYDLNISVLFDVELYQNFNITNVEATIQKNDFSQSINLSINDNIANGSFIDLEIGEYSVTIKILEFEFIIAEGFKEIEIASEDITLTIDYEITPILFGNATLENQLEFSGIKVGLYELTTLNSDIVEINNQYPQIGIHINQYSEFDHRLQSPIQTTETNEDGDFRIYNIASGIYNLVIFKEGWGFNYIYNFELSNGINEINEEILLNVETHFSGNISNDFIFETGNHYIIDDDTVFIPGSSLIIQSNAVIRINPGVDLTIHGTLTAQGEENNMFWITSNDGFNESLVQNPYIAYFNAFELSPISFINADITWGKITFASHSFVNNASNVILSYMKVSEGDIAIVNSGDNFVLSNSLLSNFSTQANVFSGSSDLLESIFYSSNSKFEISNGSALIENNYFKLNEIALRPIFGTITIRHSCFNNNVIDIAPCGLDPVIELNSFNNSETNIELNQGYGTFCNPTIVNNNFENINITISIFGDNSLNGGSAIGVENDVVAIYNYWDLENIDSSIIDDDEGYTYEVIFTPFFNSPVINAGIQ